MERFFWPHFIGVDPVKNLGYFMPGPKRKKPRFGCLYSALGHPRYGHDYRLTKIDVPCPDCGSRAMATEPNYDNGHLYTVDGGKHSTFVTFEGKYIDKPVWTVKCLSCFYNKSKQRYSEMGELYYQVTVRGDTLWAWNKEHLEMIYDFLNDASIEGHPYERFETYIHGSWKAKKAQFVKAIEKIFIQL